MGILKRFLCDSGFDEPIYENSRNEIALQNRNMVETTSFIGSIIMLALTFFSLVIPSISGVLPLYLFTAVLFCSVYIVVRFVKPKGMVAVMLCNYVFLMAAFFFAVCLDAIQKNPTATTICVLLVALPLLIVDRPWREFLFFLGASICFILETVYIKQSPKMSIDVVNAISFLGIGTFLGFKHNQMVLRNIHGQRLLKRERDTDSLTGLYNKSAFENQARCFLEHAGAKAAMFIIDMDNFKHVNDTYGHQAGDELLKKVGGLLAGLFRKEDYVCRFGGDEFIAFLPYATDRAALVHKAEQILAGMEKMGIEAAPQYRAHLCIGISVAPDDGTDLDALFRSADDAMYHVKKHGKNGYAFCDASRKSKILVVDDIEMNRAILKKVLGKEFDILEAEDGAAALAVLADTHNVMMVITDIQMPGMDGIELIKHLRADRRFDGMAIIANTQYGDAKQDEKIIRLGVDDFVYKAASPSVIQKRVKNVMKARAHTIF